MLQYVFRTSDVKRMVSDVPDEAEFITITLDFTCDPDTGTFPATVKAQPEIIKADELAQPTGQSIDGCPRPPGCEPRQLIDTINRFI